MSAIDWNETEIGALLLEYDPKTRRYPAEILCDDWRTLALSERERNAELEALLAEAYRERFGPQILSVDVQRMYRELVHTPTYQEWLAGLREASVAQMGTNGSPDAAKSTESEPA